MRRRRVKTTINQSAECGYIFITNIWCGLVHGSEVQRSRPIVQAQSSCCRGCYAPRCLIYLCIDVSVTHTHQLEKHWGSDNITKPNDASSITIYRAGDTCAKATRGHDDRHLVTPGDRSITACLPRVRTRSYAPFALGAQAFEDWRRMIYRR